MSFIVIEGLDGSGKSTQVELLRRHLLGLGRKCEYVHFPTAGSPVYGELISRFLRGEFGGLDDVNPYLVALLFAGDRYNLANTIRQWLADGQTVINDRYIYSNIGFQCAKIDDSNEADKLYRWIFDLEYEYFKIPKPDISLFLDVPFEFTRQRLSANRQGADRAYLNGKTDIHENDLGFQQKVRNTYLKAINNDSNFVRVQCFDNDNKILPPKQISQLIVAELKKKSII